MNKAKQKKRLKRLTYHLIMNGRITTSPQAAKKVKSYAEKLITRSKNSNHKNRKYVTGKLPKPAVKKLFDEIGPANSEREGGYTRIMRLGPRQGDGSQRCILEIIDV
ncbi:MAG: 50S ribosomal protein L17 [Elusimicrobiota bacterium]